MGSKQRIEGIEGRVFAELGHPLRANLEYAGERRTLRGPARIRLAARMSGSRRGEDERGQQPEQAPADHGASVRQRRVGGVADLRRAPQARQVFIERRLGLSAPPLFRNCISHRLERRRRPFTPVQRQDEGRHAAGVDGTRGFTRLECDSCITHGRPGIVAELLGGQQHVRHDDGLATRAARRRIEILPGTERFPHRFDAGLVARRESSRHARAPAAPCGRGRAGLRRTHAAHRHPACGPPSRPPRTAPSRRPRPCGPQGHWCRARARARAAPAVPRRSGGRVHGAHPRSSAACACPRRAHPGLARNRRGIPRHLRRSQSRLARAVRNPAGRVRPTALPPDRAQRRPRAACPVARPSVARPPRQPRDAMAG